MTEKKFYVYALCLPNGRPFYIGKGRGKRVFCHEADARAGIRTKTTAVILELWRRGLELHIRILFESSDERETLAEERKYIDRYHARGLVNNDPFEYSGWNTARSQQDTNRINMQLKTAEEQQLYRDLKILAIQHRLSLHDIFIDIMTEALADLDKRPLPVATIFAPLALPVAK